MNDQMKNDFMMHLKKHGNYSQEDLQNILFCMDLSAYNYDVKKKETQIIPYNQDLPQLCKTFIVCKSIEDYSKGTLYNHYYFENSNYRFFNYRCELYFSRKWN